MSSYVSDRLRKKVEKRANYVCEYCLIPIKETFFGGEIEHIISLKHEGKNIFDNLALACQPCNRNKENDLGSISKADGKLTRFYNPRTDIWHKHFSLDNQAAVTALTKIGEVTIKILRFNDFEMVEERKGLIELRLM
jgi:5-methylcytosine-specific restriction endonuclease McrA